MLAKKLNPPLVTLLSSEPEVQYVALRALQVRRILGLGETNQRLKCFDFRIVYDFLGCCIMLYLKLSKHRFYSNILEYLVMTKSVFVFASSYLLWEVPAMFNTFALRQHPFDCPAASGHFVVGREDVLLQVQ